MALRAVSRRGLAVLSRNSGGLGLGLGLVTVRGLKIFTLPDLSYDYGNWSPTLAERSCNSTTRSTTRPTSPTSTKPSSTLTRPWPKATPPPSSNYRAPSNSTAEVRSYFTQPCI
ncbi:hypothetical protein Prudu_015728 [Prunus dulcis]|uniref:Uncharacterized protein n=1 Tax=Prunus dulcis TaxID=3755 RepID=A0A4Y1RKD9_PRUDU|nr:hypothetical protein Prudu_015728 [Prunus dulcis]